MRIRIRFIGPACDLPVRSEAMQTQSCVNSGFEIESVFVMVRFAGIVNKTCAGSVC